MNIIPKKGYYYCFDFFDTISSRKVAPEYIKKIWSKQICKVFHFCSTSQLYNDRSQFERELCEKNQRDGFDLEFRYKDLIRCLFSKYKKILDCNFDYFYSICLNQEIVIEKRNQLVNPDVIEIIDSLNRNGNQIFIISDFYHQRSFIEQLLPDSIKSKIDNIYVSSECLFTKRTGRLYDYFLEKEKAESSNAVMIGDNAYSDIEIAKNMGFETVHIDRNEQMKKYSSFNMGLVDIKPVIQREYDLVNRDMFEDLTFSLYNFIDKLYFYAIRKGISDLFFLSREGQFLKKLFDEYQNNTVIDKNYFIKSHYFLVSRKSTLMPSLKNLQDEDFYMIFRQYINISLFDFLSTLGFEIDEIKEIGNRINVKINEKIENFPESVVFEKLNNNNLFQTLYSDKRNTQHCNFKEYLYSFDSNIDKQFAIVDVGWKGTIQDNIFNFFNQEKEIEGIYLGLVSPGIVNEKNKKTGLLFCYTPSLSKYYDVYNENKTIFEVILGADHGSADSYIKKDGIISVGVKQQTEEKELYNNVIKPCQDIIMSRFISIVNSVTDLFYDIENEQDVLAEIHAKMVYLPTKKQIDLFYNIYHYENYGVFEFSVFKTKSHIPMIDRMRNLSELIKKRRLYLNQYFWSIVALKDSGLSLLIKPYGIYMYLKFLSERNC